MQIPCAAVIVVASMGPDGAERLRAVGLSDEGIHSAAAVTAYFNFVNRIALGLGVELEVDDEAPESADADMTQEE